MNYRIICADVIEGLRQLADQSVQTCVTSPPYFGLRDYGVSGQIGLESTPDEYVARLVDVFREVRRVLANDGSVWLNLGDSHANDGKWGGATGGKHAAALHGGNIGRGRRHTGLKPKDLIGIPWRVAFALQADGWYLRQCMPWVKRNGMPESTKDRPTTSCESVFLLSKAEIYFYDYDAVRKPVAPDTVARYDRGRDSGAKYADGGPGRQTIARTFDHMKQDGHGRRHAGFNDREFSQSPRELRARRNSDWFLESLEGLITGEDGDPLAFLVNTTPFPDAHFAVMPEALVEPCILAGCPEGGTVLDPFTGSGTTGVVALKNGRNFVGTDLNPEYVTMARRRLASVMPMFAEEIAV